MIQFILILLGLACGNSNTATVQDSGNTVTIQNGTGSGFESGGDEGGPTSGNTGQTPPPLVKP